MYFHQHPALQIKEPFWFLTLIALYKKLDQLRTLERLSIVNACFPDKIKIIIYDFLYHFLQKHVLVDSILKMNELAYCVLGICDQCREIWKAYIVPVFLRF